MKCSVAVHGVDRVPGHGLPGIAQIITGMASLAVLDRVGASDS